MASNIEVIRRLEQVITELYADLEKARQAALADDGMIDADEQVDIDRVARKIETAQGMVADRLAEWEKNKAAYSELRDRIDSSMTYVEGCSVETLQGEKQKVLDALPGVDQAAAEEDYATALQLAEILHERAKNFLDLVEQTAANAKLESMTPEELAGQDLIEGSLDECFSEEYMETLATVEIKGEGSPDLAEIMRKIEGGPLGGAERTEIMAGLAGIVGDPPSATELDADYGRFLILRTQQEAIGEANSAEDVEGVDEKEHPDFMASRGQLLFGKVLGKAFDIHEVFASLLSSTGGLVGPGNESFHFAPDNPIGLHGTVHDAAGYLKTYHNEGPGYNYRESTPEAIATAVLNLLPDDVKNEYLPYTGQVSGVYYWVMEAGDEYAEARIEEAAVMLEKELTEVRDEAARMTAEAMGAMEQAKEDMIDTAEEYREAAEDKIEELERDAAEFARDAEAEILEARDAFNEGIENAQNSAVEAFEEAEAELRYIEEAALEKLNAIENFIWS